MAIPSKQIGWGTESNLLWEISKQLERLTGVTSSITPGGGGGGTNGTSGTSGTSGSSGLTGSSGASGSSGSSGTSGTAGSSGISGDHFSSDSSDTLSIASSGTLAFQIEPGLSWTAAQQMIVAYDSTNYMIVIVDSYNPLTGGVEATIDSKVGSGTYSSWMINTVGAPGLSGSSGTSGVNGTSGVDGTSGVNGTSGTSGIDGINGSNGTSGSSGSSGLTGTSGSSGSSGINGTSGIDGTSGTSGTRGTSGTSGTTGTSGTSGTAGSSGTSGITPTSVTTAVRLFVSAARSNTNAFLFNSITVTNDSSAAPGAASAFLVTAALTTVKVYLRDSIASNSCRIDILKSADGSDFSTATSVANSTQTLTLDTVGVYTFTGLTINQYDAIYVKVTPGTGGTNQYYGIVTIE